MGFHEVKMAFKLQPNAISKFLNTSIIGDWLDYWSIVHVFAGGALFYLSDDWRVVLSLLIIWELIEYVLWGILFKQESVLNIGVDILLGMVGFFLVKAIIMGKLW